MALFHTVKPTAQTIYIKPSTDTVKLIEIISANSMRQISLNHSTVLETLAGNAVIRQGKTILSGDSIVLDKTLGIAEVFGHVHINDNNTTNTYASYLRYVGNEQMAYLKDQVVLSDNSITLNTNSLTYNVKTGIATYENGGRVTNGATVMTSNSGIYYSDTRDAFFNGNVILNDPKYQMRSESLRYNTEFKNVYFTSKTHIKSENGNVESQSGNYNIESGEALFYDRTVFRDGPRTISGNRVAVDEKSHIIQIEDNAKFTDTENKIIILGNQLLINKVNHSFLATRKPVMIMYENGDSTYISADTLFSAQRLMDSTERAYKHYLDSSHKKSTDAAYGRSEDSISYFKGFHHVKIFNDSIQAVCDSMYFSSLDSSFKLIQHPICWNGNTQLTGDTISVATSEKKPKRLTVTGNAMLINKTDDGFFNQLAGKIMTGQFVDGALEQIRDRGTPAESIFYPQDEDSTYIGMNRSKGDVIEIFFKNKNVYKIKFTKDVEGTLYPLNQIPEGMNRLRNFLWQWELKPKSKLDIFE